MEPFTQWMQTYDTALEDLIMKGLVEQVGEGETATYCLSTKGQNEGKKFGELRELKRGIDTNENNDANLISFLVNAAQSVIESLMTDGLFGGIEKPSEDGMNEEEELEELEQKIAEYTADTSTTQKPKPGELFHQEKEGPSRSEETSQGKWGQKKDRACRLRSIPATAGGPYLCDSDSDVTVPITMVENLEMVEDSEVEDSED
jgi:hypothetical protein